MASNASGGEDNDTKAKAYYCDCPQGYGGPTCLDPKELITKTSTWGMLYDFFIGSETGNIVLGSAALILVVAVVVTMFVFQHVKRQREKYSAVVSDENADGTLKGYECSSSIRSQAERWRNIV